MCFLALAAKISISLCRSPGEQKSLIMPNNSTLYFLFTPHHAKHRLQAASCWEWNQMPHPFSIWKQKSPRLGARTCSPRLQPFVTPGLLPACGKPSPQQQKRSLQWCNCNFFTLDLVQARSWYPSAPENGREDLPWATKFPNFKIKS